MINSLMMGTSAMVRVQRYCDEIMGTPGMVLRPLTAEETALYCVETRSSLFAVSRPFDERSATVGNASIVAIGTASSTADDAIHGKVFVSGGAAEDAVGVRNDSPSAFYRACLRDRDGSMLCAVYARAA